MSRVYFHTPSAEGELWGGERGWLGNLCADIAVGLANVRHHADTWKKLTSPSHYLRKEGWQYSHLQWIDSFETALHVNLDSSFLVWNGKPVDIFSLILNTASAVGSDAVKLAARIHGQCEIHCFVEGVDRAWLAQLISSGMSDGVFRRNTGAPTCSWESVQRLLLDRDDEPVVMSYSVTDQFPSQEAAEWEPDIIDDDDVSCGGDAWYDLTHDQRWEIAMDAIRKSPKRLRLNPAEWGNFNFNHGLTMMDLIAPDHEARLAKALGTSSGS